ncbi:MAG: hypothetical protein JWM28_3538 [Chitinophagaceae bacterium]|nr:hypothetical protein [Chitinophagaceae bacterium]
MPIIKIKGPSTFYWPDIGKERNREFFEGEKLYSLNIDDNAMRYRRVGNGHLLSQKQSIASYILLGFILAK